MARLDDLLRESSKEAIARELMEEYRQAYQIDCAANLYLHEALLKHLGSYLSRNIPTNLEKYAPHLREELNEFEYFRTSEWTDEMPHLLISQEGLSFLKSLNAIISATYSNVILLKIWVLGLKCVAHLNNLPLDYFDVRNSQHPLGLPEAGNSGVISSAPPHVGVDFNGRIRLTGDKGEGSSTSNSISTSTEEEAKGETSTRWFDSGEAEYNADILESHLFNYLIAT
ncbi:hypothetical protein AAF712_004854 [Marasmius tenuissimus]|uniref:Uncharacterized protein n=1 Tax=Marasmius tenuissimus TaxID=585030 RepID=A0ABR3A488_9AGAR